MNTPFNEITIIGTPRSGTNFLCDTLKSFSEIASLFEVFNPRGVFGTNGHPEFLAHFQEVSGTDISKETDQALIDYVAANRVRFLEELPKVLETAGKSIVSYKIFPNQLSKQELDTVFTTGNRVFLLIARSRIDTFISFKKAMQIDNWANVSTKDIEIEVDLDEFMEWAKRMDRWYNNAQNKLREAGRRYVMFSYDSDINVAKPVLIEKIYLALRALGGDLAYPLNINPPAFRRQDAQSAPFTKILNGEELKQQLINRQLLASYALRTHLTPAPQPVRKS